MGWQRTATIALAGLALAAGVAGLTALGVAAASPLAAAEAPPAAAEAVELGPRYIDPQNGFSLCPPAETERTRETAVSRLVRWTVRDEKTAAIAWTLVVRREPPLAAGQTMKEFAEKYQFLLGRQANIRVDGVTVGPLAGHDAMWVRTELGQQQMRRWQSEVWVPADAERMLVVSANGPLADKTRLEAILHEVAGTLEVTDPKAQAAARVENLARGQELLKGLTDAKLAAAAAGEPQWFLYQRKGRDVGYFYVATAMAQRGAAKGLEVRTFARLELRGGEAMYVRRTMFSTCDRLNEQWTESVHVHRTGKATKTMAEEGTCTGGEVVCKITADGKSTTHRKPVPALTAAHYMPRAMGLLLPKLVNLAKPAGYAFAGYTTAADDFDMRTFAVAGPEKITLAAQTVDAVKASDQAAADSEAATLDLTADGTLLRMRIGGGITMDQSTAAAVARRFPDAETMVKGK
jgi:hypothetical protein